MILLKRQLCWPRSAAGVLSCCVMPLLPLVPSRRLRPAYRGRRQKMPWTSVPNAPTTSVSNVAKKCGSLRRWRTTWHDNKHNFNDQVPQERPWSQSRLRYQSLAIMCEALSQRSHANTTRDKHRSNRSQARYSSSSSDHHHHHLITLLSPYYHSVAGLATKRFTYWRIDVSPWRS